MLKKMNKPYSPNKAVKSAYRIAEYNEFVRFTAFPKFLRVKEFGIKTDAEFGKKYHLSKDTVTDWKRSDEFWDSVTATWKRWGKDRTPDVILGIYRKASMTGDAGAAKLWMEVIEDFKERGEVEHSLSRKTLKDIQDNMRRLVESDSKKVVKK